MLRQSSVRHKDPDLLPEHTQTEAVRKHHGLLRQPDVQRCVHKRNLVLRQQSPLQPETTVLLQGQRRAINAETDFSVSVMNNSVAVNLLRSMAYDSVVMVNAADTAYSRS